jgi:hypothetical protein
MKLSVVMPVFNEKKIGWKDGVRALWCLTKYAVKEPQKKALSS